LDDSDLYDGSLPKGGGDGSGSNGKIVGLLKKMYTNLFFFFFLPPASQGAIAGIVSAVVATVIGAVSSFIAYQKKKLCFKQSGKNS
ncbi:CD99 antigen-like 2, partial [Leptosomus discolor]